MRLRRKERTAQEVVPQSGTVAPADTPVSGFKIQEPAAQSPTPPPPPKDESTKTWFVLVAGEQQTRR